MPEEKNNPRRRLREALEGRTPMQGERQTPQPAPGAPQLPMHLPAQPPAQPPQGQPEHMQQRRPADITPRLRERAGENARARLELGMLPGDSPGFAALMDIMGALVPRRLRGELRLLGVAHENETYQRTITGTWLTDDVIPLAPTSEIPNIRTEEPSFFARFERSVGYSVEGVYLWGTDEVHVTSESLPEAERLKIITHENLHYFSREGRIMAYQQENGRTARPGFIRWINEGLTELFAHQITRARTFPPPTDIAYPYETIAAHYLLMAVSTSVGSVEKGREILLAAYITGDFTQIRVFTNMTMGAGTFEQFVRMGTGAEACAFLESRIPAPEPEGKLRMRRTAQVVPHSQWTGDQVVVFARNQLKLGEISGRPSPSLGRD